MSRQEQHRSERQLPKRDNTWSKCNFRCKACSLSVSFSLSICLFLSLFFLSLSLCFSLSFSRSCTLSLLLYSLSIFLSLTHSVHFSLSQVCLFLNSLSFFLPPSLSLHIYTANAKANVRCSPRSGLHCTRRYACHARHGTGDGICFGIHTCPGVLIISLHSPPPFLPPTLARN